MIMIIIKKKKKKKKPSQDVTVNNDLEARHVYLNCVVLSFLKSKLHPMTKL